ncbi:MAG: DEAD/DEAH box helicase [Firmicutes bacterium ADurb.Bin193]|nr:MAG: DEAD/DEAH box helicase [Firmicutes bacterium ADurb.Bin193]
MKKLNLNWITDIIGDDYKNWKPEDIVLLTAQTSTGKTYFVKNVLLDSLIKDELLLYVCNRTNLKRQFKIDLLEQYNMKVPDTIEELDKIARIGNVIVTSYHKIQHDVLAEIYDNESLSFNSFKYIVLDECHYILSDGSFNNKTRFAFDKLIYNNEYKGIRIFISATMQELKESILQITFADRGNLYNIHEYSTGIDYSYIVPKYFKEIKTIVNLIKNDKSRDKWLVFVSNLNDGNYICKELGKDICSLIQSGTKDSSELSSIITDSKFKKKVLVATKVLDNGVNFKDDDLANIVIMTWDYTTFIQMLGRKRIDINNAQNITLYLPTRCNKSFTSLLHKYNKLMDIIIQFDTDKNAFYKNYDNDLKDLKDFNNIFYRNKYTGQFEINPIGYYRLTKDIKFAEYMIKCFEEDKQFAFVHRQLSWIGLGDDCCSENLIEDVVVNDILESLEDYLERLYINQVILFDKEQQELKEFITKDFDSMINKLTGRHTKREPSAKIINKLLVMFNIPYTIDNSTRVTVNGKQLRCWTITKI